MRKRYAIHVCPVCKVINGKIAWATDNREVEVMAEAGNYAMVRRKGCSPYVAPIKEIIPCTKSAHPSPENTDSV